MHILPFPDHPESTALPISTIYIFYFQSKTKRVLTQFIRRLLMKISLPVGTTFGSIVLFALFIVNGGEAESETKSTASSKSGQAAQAPIPKIDKPVMPPASTWDKQGWARTWDGKLVGGAPGPDVISHAVSVSRTGHVFVAGSFLGTIDFDPSPDATVTASSSRGYDCFLSKYDMTGKLLWVKTWGGMPASEFKVTPRSVDADNWGNVYLTGDFMGPVDFDPDPAKQTILKAKGGMAPDPFLCKIDSDGKLLWR
jgi:hypothetical protein